MNEDTFWKLIAKFNWKETGDDDAVLKPAVDALAKMPEADICTFSDILAEKLHALDTRVHCRACYAGQLDPDNGDDYISADDFLYCRCVVVANGQKYFEDILSNPAKWPQEMEFESLLYLAGEAYEQKTGEDFTHSSPIDYESFRNQEGWAPSEETRSGKFTGEAIPPGNRRPT